MTRTNTIDVWELDMGEHASVQILVLRIGEELPRPDIALLDVGISPNHYVASVEG